MAPGAASRVRLRIKENEETRNEEQSKGSDTPWAIGPANFLAYGEFSRIGMILLHGEKLLLQTLQLIQVYGY